MDNMRLREWDILFMNFAHEVAKMSRAKRLNVGAVAVRDRRVIAIGYNGTPPGDDNCCEELVELTIPFEDVPKGELVIWEKGRNWILKTKPNVIHAEDNLIKFSKENNINLSGCTLYMTHSPCPVCCAKIKDAGFIEIVYDEDFRDTSGLLALKETCIIRTLW